MWYFYPTHYVFQDQHLGKMIGLTKERNELYYLETSSKSSVSFISEHHFFLNNKIGSIIVGLDIHCFRTLKISFPSLFRKLDIKSFHCEVCELAKYKRSNIFN